MKFGLLYEMETPRPWHALSEYNTYWEALAQIELADRLGFDYVWEVEHHFLEEYSHSPAPEVFYGAVTQRTKNIRIAHGVRLLPFNFNHPIKVAEQAAVLDIMSNGRVDLGTGRSTTAQELDGFGVNYDRTRDEVKEALEIIVKAWTEEVLGYDGKLMKVPPRRVVPKPIQKPHPPMWMACVAPDSYEMAGDRGLGVLSFNFNWEQVQQHSFLRKRARVGRHPSHLSPFPQGYKRKRSSSSEGSDHGLQPPISRRASQSLSPLHAAPPPGTGAVGRAAAGMDGQPLSRR